jgi:4-hydroxyphenylacetate 3-monooxygenase
MGLMQHDPTIEYIVDLITEVQTVRTCLTAAEHDPEPTPQGYCIPGRRHIAVGSIAMQKARQRVTEILRILPGSSLVVAPSDGELPRPELAAGLEESFGGGGYTALQRSALLSLAWDHISSALDGRESAFELHANGGLPGWRMRLRRDYDRYNELANGVLRALSVEMPAVDVSGIRAVPMMPRRQVTPPTST